MPKTYQSKSSANITSITYWRRFAKHRLIYLILAGVMGIGIVAYFGNGPLGGAPSGADRQRRSAQPVVTVNGEAVTRSQYEHAWEQMKRAAGGSELQAATFQGMILANLVNQALARSVAKQQGITVSDADVDKAIDEQKKTLGRGKPVSDAEFAQMLDAQGFTLADVREDMKQSLLPQILRDRFIKNQKVSEGDFEKTFDKAHLRHILVSTSKLPDAQAKAKAEKILAEIRAGKDFAKLADEFTDDPTNAPTRFDPKQKKSVPTGLKKGGDLGWASLSTYVPEFAEAARKLKPGEVSGVVKTSFGYHIIKMVEMKRDFPADFARNRAKLFEDYKAQKAQGAFADLMQKAQKQAKIVWNDPGLEWRYDYAKSSGMMGTVDMDALRNQGAFQGKLRDYAAKHPEDSGAALVLGQDLYRKYMLAAPGPEKNKERDEIIKLYEAGLKSTEDQGTRITLAQLYREAGKKEDALRHYKLLQRLLRWESGEGNKMIHTQLQKAFAELGEPELAKQETVRIAQITSEEMKRAEETRRAAEEQKRKEAEAKKNKPAAASAGAPAAPAGNVNVQPGGTVTVTPGGASSTKPVPIPAPPGGKAGANAR